MPRIAYFDTFSGMSGDMALGALVDAGLPLADLASGLRGLRVKFELTAEKVKRGAFEATRVKVVVPGEQPHHDHGHQHEHHQGHQHDHPHDHPHKHPHDHHHHHHHGPHDHPHNHAPSASRQPPAASLSVPPTSRHLPDILQLLEASGLPEPVRAKATAVFRNLARAEGKIHGIPPENVHFHEVGAVDSIVDIAGVCLGLHLLGVEEAWCSPATLGTGFVKAAHGEIPLPAPATLELLRGFPVRQRETGYELTTPTGAALAVTLARGFGPMPELVVSAIGYGAGDDRPLAVPNVLRVVLGERTGAAPISDRVVCLETNVDDMSPQWLGHLVERLLAEGALDAWLVPAQMKKSRAAHEIRVLAPLGSEERLAEILFHETTTFGVRRFEVDRWVLDRSFETVTTPWGEVRIKVGRREGRVLSATPEYEDLRRAAAKGGVPLKEVHRRALSEYHQTHPGK